MKDQEILETLDIANVSEELQQETLTRISQVVELRLMGLYDEAMTDEQKQEFKKVSAESPENAWKWLNDNVVNIAEAYNAMLADYIDELKKKQA